MSDIHFEFMGKDDLERFWKSLEDLKKRDPANTLVLAGDICQVGQGQVVWQALVARFCGFYSKVVYVPGNHEYYRTTFNAVDKFFSEIVTNPNLWNLVQLDYGPIAIEGHHFIGNTMWFQDIKPTYRQKRGMHDFSVIGSGDSPFEPEVYNRHQEFVDKVLGQCQANDIVVSHHLPLPASIDAQYHGSELNPFFMTNMNGHLAEDRLPALWIHGHTHSPVDYEHTLGTKKMRVYCNPLGYPFENENSHFWDRVGVDIPDQQG